jgi:RNA polymerase sigma-70 factor, ECF subfamily
MAIARRAAADAIRREQRIRRNRAALPIGRDTVDDASGVYALDDLIESLAGDQREAFVLTQVIGLTYDEAAAVCEVKIGTIRSRVARAREQLTGDLGRAAEV